MVKLINKEYAIDSLLLMLAIGEECKDKTFDDIANDIVIKNDKITLIKLILVAIILVLIVIMECGYIYTACFRYTNVITISYGIFNIYGLAKSSKKKKNPDASYTNLITNKKRSWKDYMFIIIDVLYWLYMLSLVFNII